MTRRRLAPLQRAARGLGVNARLVPWIAGVALVALAAGACIQQSNTYPVELFKEMHYSQAHRSQEPPRQAPVRRAVAFVPIGGPDVVLERTRSANSALRSRRWPASCTA